MPDEPKSISDIYDEMMVQEDPAPEEMAVEPEAPADEPEDKESEPAQVEEPDEVVTAPTGWSDEERGLFATLPPDAQNVIAKRESERERELTRQTQDLADQRKSLGELDNVIGENRQRWDANGLSPAAAFRQLLAAERALEQSPREAIAHLARHYGVDLSSFNQQQRRIDPTIAQLQQQVAQLTGQLNQQTNGVRQQRQQEAEAFIERWGNETGTDGQPLRPYFQQVMGNLTDHIPVLRKANPGASFGELLEKAYEREIWANGEIRSTLQDAERRKAEAKRAADRKKAAAEAKKAASSVPASQAGPSVDQPKSLRATIEEHWDAAAS